MRASPIGMITDQQTAVHTARLRTESRTEYSCRASGAPGPQQVVELAQRGVRLGQVAHQVGGQDPVERARARRPGQVGGVPVHETDPLRPDLAPGLGQHLGRGVHRGDVGLGRGVEQRGGGRAGAAAQVEQPQPGARGPGRPIRCADIRRCSW